MKYFKVTYSEGVPLSTPWCIRAADRLITYTVIALQVVLRTALGGDGMIYYRTYCLVTNAPAMAVADRAFDIMMGEL